MIEKIEGDHLPYEHFIDNITTERFEEIKASLDKYIKRQFEHKNIDCEEIMANAITTIAKNTDEKILISYMVGAWSGIEITMQAIADETRKIKALKRFVGCAGDCDDCNPERPFTVIT